MALTIEIKDPDVITKDWQKIIASDERKHFVRRLFHCLQHSKNKDLYDLEIKDAMQMENDAYITAESRADYYFKITTFCYELLKASDDNNSSEPDEGIDENLLEEAHASMDKLTVEG